MIPVLSVDNMKRSDAAAVEKVSAERLMSAAGKAVFDALDWREPVAVVCGPGNNGGDGFVIALEMLERGMNCALFLTSERLSPAASKFYAKCAERGLKGVFVGPETDLRGYATVVDCVFGTGFRGTPEGVYAEAVEKINSSGARVVSVDINSGLNGDSGLAELCVRSDVTVSIGSFKPGHFLNMASDVMADRINCDIGIEPAERPYYLLEARDLAPLFPARKHYSHKGTYGYTALIGGSLRYSGAIRLAALSNAAMRAGAGVVFAAVPRSIAPIVAGAVLESTVYPLSDSDGSVEFDPEEMSFLADRCGTVACGMGMGGGKGTDLTVSWLLANYKGTLILDADGLNALARMPSGALRQAVCKRVVLTPHVGEFARLLGTTAEEVQERPIEHARAYAAEQNCIVLLKGPATVITDGSTVYLTDRGCPGMATGGSGDVLSSICAAVCGYAEDALLGAAGAAYINGLAGELAEAASNPVSMTAGDTAAHITVAVSRVLKKIAKDDIITSK